MVNFLLGLWCGQVLIFILMYAGFIRNERGKPDMCNDCERLHEQLQQQAGEMFGLKKNINRLRSALKKEKREKAKILEEKHKNQKPHLIKGQKRGARGFHG